MRVQLTFTTLFVVAVSGCALWSPRLRSSVVDGNCMRAWRISFPEVRLDVNERILALQLNITRGRVAAINHIPTDWSMTVDAGYADRPSVSGSAAHGAGSLLSTEELRWFVTVCEVGSMPVVGDMPFTVEGTLATTTDFETTRDRTFTMRELILQESASNNAPADPRWGRTIVARSRLGYPAESPPVISTNFSLLEAGRERIE